MNSYSRLNVITGWCMFILATVVYTLTLEPTMPFWDCGEFLASSYKLEVGHPPGAPLFMLLARLFSAFVPTDKVAFCVNFLSAVSSGATVMFLHWSITHMAKKLADLSGPLNSGKTWAIIGSGIIGSLAFTFSDTFWFSAVESEVYAMSSLFTAIVFWAILKWESVVDDTGSLRWLVLIAYLMGLSIGVHLLNLLAIPAICLVYYFKYYKVTPKGLIFTAVISLALLALIQTGVIIWAISLAGWFERLFVNSWGLPFNSGAIFYLLLLIALITAGLIITKKRNWIAANTLILGITVAIVGYTTFATVIIRSQANPPMDENNPENIFALLSYLNREQYGDRPLLFGQYFNTPEDVEEPYKDGADVWVKSYSVKESSGARRLVASYRERFEAEEYVKSHPETKLVLVEEYIESGEKKKSIPNYEKSLCGIFPRMHSSAGNHIADYKEWSNYHDWNTAQGRKKVQALEQTIRELEQEQKQIEYYLSRGKDKLEPGQRSELQSRFMTNRKMLEKKYQDAIPTKAEDIRFFLSYQTGWMYLRYFMWNFAGRQNDSQGGGDILDGNWISGINAIDADRIGNQDHLTSNMLSNHGRNAFFYLPLILGLIGIIFQLTKHPKDFSVVALLFLLTGWAIVVYLNQTPQQPRERDYAYAGSFYAFAIWIGLSVIALFEAVKILDWKKLGSLAAMSLGGSAVIFALEHALKDSSALGLSLLFISAVIVAMVALMMVVRGKTDDQPWKAFLAVIICLPAPILMCADGWDDHSRANRRTGVDMAWNYLSSIDQNGIIFTNGDNDTFPLWYAQEVEGTRTDVRVVNLSLLNTDWYIDQMKRQAYESAPVPFSIPEQKYRQGTRDVLFVDPYGEADKTGYMSVKDAIAFCLDEKNTIDNGGKLMHYLPTYKLKMEIDSATRELFRPMLKEGDSLVFELRFQLSDDRGKPKSYITKAQLMCLDLLANMDWKRPVYFAVTTGGDAYMGLENYFQLEGLAYRLTPILHPRSENPNLEGGVGTDQMYHKMMDLFRWGNMDKYDIYMDENNRRMTSNLRLQFSHLADALVNEGKKDEAIKVLDRCLEVMPEKTVPYDQPQIMWQLAEIYYDAGDSVKALNLSKRLIELGKEDLAFYNSLDLPNREKIQREFGMRVRVMDRLVAQAENHFPNDPEVKKLSEENNALISTELMEELGIDPRERQMVRTGASSARRPSPKAAPDSTTVVNFGNDTITKKRVSKKN